MAKPYISKQKVRDFVSRVSSEKLMRLKKNMKRY